MKYLRYTLWAFVGLAFVVFIALNLPKKAEQMTDIMPVAGFNQGAHFTLTTHEGKSFSSANEIGQGDYALLFFGFTHCPVICPTELQKMAQILDDLPPAISAKISPLFITVDPERDDVDAMQAYVPMFHERIIGLTDDVETIHNVLANWKVFFTKVNDPQFTEYTMDHSTYAYLVNHDMQIMALYRMKDTAENMTSSIAKIVQ